MRYIILLFLAGCGPQFTAINWEMPRIQPEAKNTIIQSEVVMQLNTGVETVSKWALLLPKALAAEQAVTSWVVSATSAPGVNFNATFTPSSPTIDISTGLVKLGIVAITQLDDNSVRKCGAVAGSTGNMRCNRAYVQFFTSNAGFLGSGDMPDTIPALIGPNSNALANVSSGTNGLPYTSDSVAISSNRFKINQLTNTTYEVYSDFSNAGDGVYSTTLTIRYAIGKE